MDTYADEPVMSDTTILVTVEELINRAMGPPDGNLVDFKLIKMIIEIMARQLRIMQQRIEVRSIELKEVLLKKRKGRVSTESNLPTRSSQTAKKRRKSTQKYQTKASKWTASSKEVGTEDIVQSDKNKKSKDKSKEKLEKDKGKEETTETQVQIKKVDKAEVLGGITEYEEEVEELRQLTNNEVTEKVAQDGQKLLAREILGGTNEYKERLEKKEIGVKSGQSSESLAEKEKVVKNESSETRIQITEKQVDHEKILVVEKGAPIALEARSRSGIEFITQSQFAIVEAEIRELSSREVPKSLTLPENQKLMKDIREGAVKLPEVMQTLQVEERMKSAEESMTNIVGLLTTLTSAGVLPEEIAEQVRSIIVPSTLEEEEKRITMGENKLVSIPSTTPMPSTATKSMASTVKKIPCVTRKDMSAELKNLKDDVTKILGKFLEKPTGMLEIARCIVKDVGEKINVTHNLHGRITALSSLVVQHNERFSDFETTLTTLMESIEDQLAEFQRTVESGLHKFATVNFNAEAEAVMKITQCYEDLEMKLTEMLHEHKALTDRQTALSMEMHTLIECIERMREEKSDRDEFRDQLQYKADKSQLTETLRGSDFAEARVNFERRIDECHERFNRSVATWATAVKDIKQIKEYKADFVELLATRELVEKQLRKLDNKISIASAMLGDPEVALQSRKLALGAICGSCHEAARVEPYDVRKGAPPRLPALGKPPVEAPKEQFIPDWVRNGQPLHRLCRRWCGGSHTILQNSSKRMQLKIHLQALPSRKFADYGDDGRLYMLEEELQPCIECNALDGEETPDHEAVKKCASGKCSCPLVQ